MIVRMKLTIHIILEKNDKKESDSAYVIKDANDAIVEGYTVDAYFNIQKGKM